MPQHRAVEWLHRIGQQYPMAWDLYARLLQQRANHRKGFTLNERQTLNSGSFMDWPDYCYAPMATAHAVISLKHGTTSLEPVENTGGLAAVAAWRATQGIYRIDPTLFTELLQTPVTGRMPCEVLKRMPAWCVYIEVPEGTTINHTKLYGFFAFLEYDIVTCEEMLRFALDVEGAEKLWPLLLHMAPTIDEALERTDNFIRVSMALLEKNNADALDFYERSMSKVTEAYFEESKKNLAGLLSVVLYLCAEDTDVPRLESRPERVVTTKKGRVIVPAAKKPVVYECGTRIGAELRWVREHRAQIEEGARTGRTVMGHIRSAHYHTFLTGPRGGKQVPRIKWLPPIRVNLDDAPKVATIHAVR